MRLRVLAGVTATAVTAGLVIAAGAPTAGAAGTVVVNKADFVAALSDTRSAGHLAYQADGLHLWTDNATSQAKVAEYFAMPGSLTDMIGSTPPVWTGTNPGPGGQIVFDADGVTGNGNDFNILVGEWAYDSGNDWWLNFNGSADAKAAAPSTTGGSGSPWHGSIADWATALPTARVYAGGFSLGSGVLGDGVMSSITYGTTTYTFAHGLGHCAVSEDYPSTTVTLLADCDTAIPLWAQDGWTVDGDGYTITALETPTTTFTGAVLANEGPTMHVRDLTVTTNADWDDPSKNSGGDLAGVRFKNASGSITDVTISGISHGNGVQEGNALDLENANGATQRTVTVDDVTISRYQKTGVRINGNVKATVTGSTIGSAGNSATGVPLDNAIAANSLQVSRGAEAVVRNNTITGNEWDGDLVWSASAALFYQSGNVTFEQNVVTGAGVDLGVVSQEGTGSIKVRCNLIGRNADEAGDPDIWSTGIASYDDASFAAVDNTIEGYDTPTDGVTNVVNQGRCVPNAPAVAVSNITQTAADVSWTPGAVKAYAPVSGWELSGPSGIVTLPAGTTSYHLSGLKADRDYSVSVRAINVSGGSSWANAGFDTPATPPPATKAATMTVAPKKVTFGSTATVSGRLTAGGVGSAGVAVTVWRSLGSSWAMVATVTTGADGRWSTPYAPQASGTLRATAAGYPTVTTKVKVALKVTAKAKGHKVKGKVSPTVPGSTVKLQRKKSGHWDTVAKTTLSARSKAVFTDLRSGKYRVFAKKSGGYAKGISNKVKLV